MSVITYRPSIDGVRALAVVSVLLFHLHGGLLPGGFVGVDVFFVISGYLITSIVYLENQKRDFSFARFYQRRIARIFPLFFLVSLATLVAASLLYTEQDFASSGALAASAALSITNLKLMFQGNYFEVSRDAQPFLHYWSLSVEEQFYVFLPLAIFALHKYRLSARASALFLGASTLTSFIACVALTVWRPAWAFYLLPARAWELLIGSLLALMATRDEKRSYSPVVDVASSVGLLCVLASMLLISEEARFPGYVAALPVVGTTLLIGRSFHPRQFTERVLAHPALVFIGKASYSLYLWHWPVYCFVDYALFAHSALIRLPLKLGLAVALSVASYLWFEVPARLWLNAPTKRALSFAGYGACVVVFVVAGIFIRSSNYVNASMEDIANGGVVINPSAASPAIVLMGDSNGSMYGKAFKEIAYQRNLRAFVISVAAGDPLPETELYKRSLSFLKRERPAVTILAAAWNSKIDHDQERLRVALNEILRYSSYAILVAQPPVLPETASREAIRSVGYGRIVEDPENSRLRRSTNAFLHTLESDRVIVVDVDPLFIDRNGQIIYTDHNGRQLYQDRGHLSGLGARLVAGLLSPEIARLVPRASQDARVGAESMIEARSVD